MAHIIVNKEEDIQQIELGDTYIVLPELRIDPEILIENVDEIIKLEDLVEKKFVDEEAKNPKTDNSSKYRIRK